MFANALLLFTYYHNVYIHIYIYIELFRDLSRSIYFKLEFFYSSYVQLISYCLSKFDLSVRLIIFNGNYHPFTRDHKVSSSVYALKFIAIRKLRYLFLRNESRHCRRQLSREQAGSLRRFGTVTRREVKFTATTVVN